jgi:hypothetical protein
MAKISGKIVDIDNVPLMGANITLRSGLKSGKVGTASDFDGNFSLESDSFNENDIFEISYIGFVKQTFTAKDIQNLKVTLKEVIGQLDEIVLVYTKPKTEELSENIKETKNNIKQHVIKNKIAYASFGGFLGIALIFLSIKKLN